MTTTPTADQADRITELFTEALAYGIVLIQEQEQNHRRPNRVWGSYHSTVIRLAALRGVPNSVVNDEVLTEINVQLGRPFSAGREVRLTLAAEAAASAAGLPAPEPVQRHTAAPAAPVARPAQLVVRDAPEAGIETFTCGSCAAPFSRPVVRGRKPSKCPPCKAELAEAVEAARAQHAVRAVRAPVRTASSAPAKAVPARKSGVETFTCGSCAAPFSRPVVRGRKPSKCPPCVTAAAVAILAAHQARLR